MSGDFHKKAELLHNRSAQVRDDLPGDMACRAPVHIHVTGKGAELLLQGLGHCFYTKYEGIRAAVQTSKR